MSASFPSSLDPHLLPRPGDLLAAAAGMAELAELAGPTTRAALANTGGKALFAAMFGHSPFLGRCLLTEPDFLEKTLIQGFDPVFINLVSALGQDKVADEAELMGRLRRAKRQAALLIAMADIAGAWPLEQVTAALSRLADASLGVALSFLLRRAHDAGQITLPFPEEPSRDSGLIVLGLGKLGANELNYSSDIDLILLYERDKLRYGGRRSVQEFCVRLARDLVRLLQERTADGYVFRVDLRLRPDPGSTPLALSTLAAEAYYEGMGQNWERAAMIKARPVAGDVDAGAKFLKTLRPFVWRKHLDFAAIADIHAIKRQIHAVKGHQAVAVAGHNIKLGRGGIREIEFFAQTQQLIWGGRFPELRRSATIPAIEVLVQLGKCRAEAATDLIAAYRYLRHVEHRLQMVEDQQTQVLPTEEAALERLALFCGHRDRADFTATLRGHLTRVETRYAELFEEAPSLGSAGGSLVFTGIEDDPETVRTLLSMGFPDGAAVSALVRGWHHGRYRATRSARARELLTELMPHLLQALAKSADPDAAFHRFDDFLRALPAGVQVFSMLHANPALLELIAETMGSAPLLANDLARSPALLDGVLASASSGLLPDRETLRQDLAAQAAHAADYQDALDLIRRWTKDRRFQLGLRLIEGRVDGDAAGSPLADIADIAIAALLPPTLAEFRRQHGTLPGRGLAIAALGKLGSSEMTLTSDLDLIFLYDIPAAAADWDAHLSDGAKPLPPIQYFARLAQRVIAAITAPTAEGALYEVDMRLRPSGNSGPIATGLLPFLRYQREEAWTWEHMALTRARVICGDPGFAAEIESGIAGLLAMQRNPEKLRQDCAEMRQRIRRQHDGSSAWDLKYRPGGQVDIDFIAQYLALRHAAEHPSLLAREPAAILTAASKIGLIEDQDAETLIAALRFWRRLQQMIRLMIGGRIDEASLKPAARRLLAESAGVADFDALKAAIERHAALASAIFRRILPT